MSDWLDATLRVDGIDKPLSTLALGTAFFARRSAEAYHGLLDTFTDAGGTLVDTARIYAGGESESLIGEWFDRSGKRDRIVLITKGGHGADNYLPSSDLESVLRGELAISLERLRTDWIDLYMLHRDNQEVPVSEIMEPLNALVSDGAVRTLGASNWEYRRVAEAQEYAEKRGLVAFGVVSNTLSLARPVANFFRGLVTVDPVGEAWHERTGMPLIPWSSQARGFYTDRFPPERRKNPAPDERQMYRCYGSDENFERRRRAWELGERKSVTGMEIALAWLLRRPFPVVPVVGPRTADELDSCIRATHLRLTDAESDWLDLKA
ncbi:aldo/keto reductase [Candidatus Poribacteria bacterium]|nr:aldo/keto reductase [Candidatus Poribacteria bacterium]